MNSKIVKEKMLPEGWQEMRLGDICGFRGGSGFPEIYQGKNAGDYPFIKVSDMSLPENKVYIHQSNNWITSEVKKQINATHCPASSVVFAKVGAALKLNRRRILVRDTIIDNNMMAAIPRTSETFPKFLYYYLTTKDFGQLCQESAVPSVNQKILGNLPIKLPPIESQKAIVSLLETWDTVIEKTEALIAAKEKRFKWLLKTLICDGRHKRDFVSSFATEISDRNRDGTVDRVLSVTNYSGFVLPEEQFERRVASTNLSNYKIVVNGQYGYNPSRINVGSIARLDDWDVGVLSPMYVVFSLDEEKINSDYFLHWLSSGEAKQRIKNSAQGSVRETVSFNDFCLISIPVPSMEEQQHITKTLNTLKSEISLLHHLAEQYRTQKCGLMQKLLAGEWRLQ